MYLHLKNDSWIFLSLKNSLQNFLGKIEIHNFVQCLVFIFFTSNFSIEDQRKSSWFKDSTTLLSRFKIYWNILYFSKCLIIRRKILSVDFFFIYIVKNSKCCFEILKWTTKCDKRMCVRILCMEYIN